jgi:Raf kinase inhibitor-like YbhB/YbcL family protein
MIPGRGAMKPGSADMPVRSQRTLALAASALISFTIVTPPAGAYPRPGETTRVGPNRHQLERQGDRTWPDAPGGPAKVKERNKRELPLYLVAEGDDCEGSRLSSRPTSPAERCGDHTNVLQEVRQTTGEGYVSVGWTTEKTKGLVLDPDRPIRGKVTLESFQGAGGGEATVEVVLTTRIDRRSVELGRVAESYSVQPGDSHSFSFRIKLTDSLSGKTMSRLTLVTIIRGVAVGHGWIGLGRSSSVALPLAPPASGKPLLLTSSAFRNGGKIPRRHTCQGGNLSPPVKWSGGPNAIEYVLALNDPDAPNGPLLHWLVYRISGNARSIPAGRLPAGARARNDYFGPCPPQGETHRYVFTLYALRRRAPESIARAQSQAAVDRILQCCAAAKTSLTASYGS